MSISITDILKHSSKFTGINLISKFISLPVSIIVAIILNPKDFGLLGFVSLFTSYAGWINGGATSTAFREIPGLIKKGNYVKAKHIQNVAFSVDLINSIVIFLILFIIAFNESNPIIKTIMFISFTSYLVSNFHNFLSSYNFATQNFSLSAKSLFLQTILNPVLTLLLLFIVGIYALPIAGLIVFLITIIYLLKSYHYDLTFQMSYKEAMRLIKIGIVLNIGTILYTLFTGVLDKTIIAAYLSKEELGLYLFSFNVVILFLNVFKDYARVLKPMIWANSATSNDLQSGFYVMRKMAIYFSVTAAFLIGILQISFLFLVSYVTKKFIGASLVFLILVSYLFWESLEKFPEIILTDSKVNKQKVVTYIWGVCLLLNIILDILVIHLGYGIIGIAFITTLTQAISAFLMYSFSSKYLFYSNKEKMIFYRQVFTPFLMPIIFTIIHWFTLNIIPVFIILPLSFIIQLIMWYVFIRVFYRDYFPKEIFKELFSKPLLYIRQKLSKVYIFSF